MRVTGLRAGPRQDRAERDNWRGTVRGRAQGCVQAARGGRGRQHRGEDLQGGHRGGDGGQVPGGGDHHAAVRPPAHHQAGGGLQRLSHLDRDGAGQARRAQGIPPEQQTQGLRSRY